MRHVANYTSPLCLSAMPRLGIKGQATPEIIVYTRLGLRDDVAPPRRVVCSVHRGECACVQLEGHTRLKSEIFRRSPVYMSLRLASRFRRAKACQGPRDFVLERYDDAEVRANVSLAFVRFRTFRKLSLTFPADELHKMIHDRRRRCSGKKDRDRRSEQFRPPDTLAVKWYRALPCSVFGPSRDAQFGIRLTDSSKEDLAQATDHFLRR